MEYINFKQKIDKKALIAALTGLVAVVLLVAMVPRAEAEPSDLSAALAVIPREISLIQGNSILPISDPSLVEPINTLKMVITAYSSTVWETDDTPFITASGAHVADGIVANNMLSFGTEIRIPELYGDKIFVVKDRLNSRASAYHVDIWFPEHSQALDFGKKQAYVEVLEN